jgi:uncharacterized membrane protein YccF (DUF307 family)
MGLAWWLGEALAVVAICGIAWAKACFVRGQFVFFFPFGKEAINRNGLTCQGDVGAGALGLAGSVIWFISVCQGGGHFIHSCHHIRRELGDDFECAQVFCQLRHL